MNVERINAREVVVRMDTNPTALVVPSWIEQVKAFLTGEEKTIRVDMTGLEIVSSLGVSFVVGLYKTMEQQDGTISIVVPNESVLRVFDLFGLTNLFEIGLAPSEGEQ
ncbi:STAS domain-containing protein [Candidatus Sumerlaeota bacterium]|nr:STAS domain-containing protein [Candidatus Sumerlaeota bacterium]